MVSFWDYKPKPKPICNFNRFKKKIFQVEKECIWMQESHVDWIFQGPACAVLIINLIFLIRIMWVSYMFLLHIIRAYNN